MSDVSVAVHAFAKATHSAIMSILDAVGMDPNTKSTVQASMQSALDTVTQTVTAGVSSAAEQAAHDLGADVTPSPSPIATPADALAAVEGVVGQAVEGVADAEITALTGPVAPVAVELANKLLETVGGDVQAAIAHLFRVSTGTHPASPPAPAAGSPQ